MADSDDLVVILGLIGLGYLAIKNIDWGKVAQKGAVWGVKTSLKYGSITDWYKILTEKDEDPRVIKKWIYFGVPPPGRRHV